MSAFSDWSEEQAASTAQGPDDAGSNSSMIPEEWFYLEKGRSIGPETEGGLARLLGEKVVSLDTLVWSKRAGDWNPLGQVFPAFAVQPPPLPRTAEFSSPPVAATRRDRLQLSSIDEDEERPPGAVEYAEKSWADETPHPWRRYFARMFDNVVGGLVGLFIFSVLLSQLAPETFQNFLSSVSDPSNKFLSAWITTIAAIPINAIFIGFTGSSVGKWIFGVRVLNENRLPIGFLRAVKREGIVWIRGLGLGIPFIGLFTCMNAYKFLTKNGEMSWDRQMRLSVSQRPNKAKQIVFSILGLATLVVLIAVLNTL